MSVEEVISSGLVESYVLGTASAAEIAMIHQMCNQHPELLAEIEKTEASLILLATQAAPMPGAAVKEKLTQALSLNKPQAAEAKIVAIAGTERKLKFYQVGLAASFLLFITSFVYNILLQQRVGRLNSELTELYASKSYLAQEIKIQQASISNINQRLQIVTNPGIKSITLNGMNSLANKAAMVYWNAKTDEVYFNSAGMPDSPSSKQYQLWAIVAGKPVDMGVIDLSNGGSVFQKMKQVKGATAFAVTIEKEGGSPTPSLETMCLLGNV
jgi:anti-sigma-K factor RskA